MNIYEFKSPNYIWVKSGFNPLDKQISGSTEVLV